MGGGNPRGKCNFSKGCIKIFKLSKTCLMQKWFKCHLSCSMTKTTKWSVRPAKTLISLGIRPVWSESLLCAQLVAKDPKLLHTNSEDFNWLGECPGWSESSLGTQVILLVLSCSSSCRRNSRTVCLSKVTAPIWMIINKRNVGLLFEKYMHRVEKTCLYHIRTTKTQISLHIRTVCSVS